MALNNFTDEEAIEICVRLRDKVLEDNCFIRTLKREIYYEPDALAQVINLAAERAKEKKQNG